MLFDTHAHLNAPAFDHDLKQVLARASSKTVSQMIVVGYNLASSARAVSLAQCFPKQLFAAVGIHPHEAWEANQEGVAIIRELLREPCVVAIGETGLDYYRGLTPKAQQHGAFAAMLDLSVETGLPVIIHSRDATDDAITAVEERKGNVRGVLHAFAGGLTDVERAIKAGLMISFAGPLTYPRADKLRQVAAEVPSDYILVETDCPYLPPQPWRGKRNEPGYLPVTVDVLARLRKISVEACASLLTNNALRLFRLTDIVRNET